MLQNYLLQTIGVEQYVFWEYTLNYQLIKELMKAIFHTWQEKVVKVVLNGK